MGADLGAVSGAGGGGPSVNRILVVAPHPDDEAIGCGGTIRTHVNAGDEVMVVFLTSGENGGHGRAPDETARLREREACAAAEILGVTETEFWRIPDGTVRCEGRVVDRLRQTLLRWRPSTVFVTHDREMHPDHRAAARIVKQAVQGLNEPDYRPFVFMYEVWTPTERIDHIVDISSVMATKLAAVRAYECQCAVLRFDEAVQGLNRYRGEMHSWPGGDYAEVFRKYRYDLPRLR
jgi:N-acetylglucosamine malate deacetylase 1